MHGFKTNKEVGSSFVPIHELLSPVAIIFTAELYPICRHERQHIHPNMLGKSHCVVVENQNPDGAVQATTSGSLYDEIQYSITT